MDAAFSAGLLLPALVLGAFVALLFWYLVAYLQSPLRSFPGPLLAGWTNAWRMYHVWQGKYHIVVYDLHRKYGPVVRIAPNIVDLDLPELVKTIYNIKGDWKKTEFYHGSSAKVDGKIIYNIFSQTDPAAHAREKRPIAKHYSMNGVLSLEPHIDEIIDYFCKRLEEEFIGGIKARKPCNLGEWLLFYTWDVVGKATFSQSIGYLEKGYDFDKTIEISDKAMDYFSLVGQYPILDHLLDKNPVYRIGPPGFGNITNISVQHLVDRLQGKDAAYHDPSKPDFLDKFIEAKSTHPDIVDDGQIISYLMINMIAGADTTAVTLRAVMYYSLKHPRVWQRLQEEIAVQPSNSPPLSFKYAYGLPYLNAVIREAMRLHPSVAMILERYVPPGGLSLPGGGHIPAGYITGMNPYVIARNKAVWGEDSDEFRPERWLRDEERETEDQFQKRLTLMNNSDLAFGAGSRVCIGRNLALLEVYKVVGTLVSRYDMELAYPDREWSTHNSFFLRQEGVEVKLSRRIK